MTKRKYTKYIHEGEFVAAVDVELVYTDDGWSPYLSIEDAAKLEEIHEALRKKDIELAAKHSRLYTMTPLGA